MTLSFGADSRLVSTFDKASERTAGVLLDDRSNDSPRGANTDLRLGVADYLREEDTLFITGVP